MPSAYRFDDELAPHVDRSFDFVVPDAVDDAYRAAFDDTLDAFYARLFAGSEKRFAVGDVRDATLPVAGGEIPLRVYTPANAIQPLPGMMMFHGGGFITGSIKGLDYFSRYVCNHARRVVVSVGYRLAPEHKYPIAPADCLAALAHVLEHPDAYGVDARFVSVCGDSAGGNLATVVAMMARSAAMPVEKQVLVYPCVDMTAHDTPSRRRYGAGYSLDVDELDKASLLYVDGPDALRLPYVSPLLADDAHLRGLPEAFIATAGCCPLTSDCAAYAARLRENGIAVTEKLYRRMPHSFIIFNYPETFAALDDICRFLRGE